MDPDRFEVAADTSGLDVGDLAGPEFDGVRGAGGRDERLVEADRRLDLGGQAGVADDVVLGQGLLDQEEVELVEAAQVRAVGPAVGGVGVDLERRRPDR